MTWEEYWKGDPYLVVYYREAHRINMQEENYKMWLQGAYIHDAVAVAIGEAFGDKNKKKPKYVEKPYDIMEKTEEQKSFAREQAKEKVVNQLKALKEAWDNGRISNKSE